MNRQPKKNPLGQAGRLIVAVLLAGGLAFAAGAATDRPDTDAVVPDSVVSSLKEQSRAFAAIEKATSPAVVSIRVEKSLQQVRRSDQMPFNRGESPFGDDLLQRFFGDQPQNFRGFRPQNQFRAQSQGPVSVGQGSGFIVTSDGDIITNNHVVENADRVIVRLRDGREFDAQVLGADSHTDVAVLRIEASSLPTLPFGDSEALEVGEWVLASGAPFGLTHTLTAGIVSAVGRSSVGITDYENFIQTDAAINPGNSGGPLLNLNGQVVGMNTAIFSRSGGSMGVGFAIPVNMVRNIYEQITDHGSVTRAYLGVLIQPVTQELASSFGASDTRGALIGQVGPGTPGSKAGLKEGDIVVAIDGKRYDDVGRVRNAIALTAPGTTIDLTVIRDGKEQHVRATLEELPDSDRVVLADSRTGGKWGFAAQNLTPEIAEQLSLSADAGVIITDVKSGSAADRAGLQPGMLVEQVNRRPVSSLADFQQVMDDVKGEESLLLLVRDGQTSRFIVLNEAS